MQSIDFMCKINEIYHNLLHVQDIWQSERIDAL